MKFAWMLLACCISTFSSPSWAQNGDLWKNHRPIFTDEQLAECQSVFESQIQAAKLAGTSIELLWYDPSYLAETLERGQPVPGSQPWPRRGSVDIIFHTTKVQNRASISPEYSDIPQKMASMSRLEIYTQSLRALDKSKSPGIASAFETAESKVQVERTESGVVMDQTPGNTDTLLGSLRIYNGTPGTYSSDWSLPVELMYQARDMKATQLTELRAKNPGKKFKEAGNYFLPPLIKGDFSSVTLHLRVKVILLKLWKSKHVDTDPNTIWIAHVASKPHASLYQKEFGFKILQTDQDEMILYTTGAALQIKLDEQLKAIENRLGTLQ